MALLNPLGGESRVFKANSVGRIAIIERSKVSFTGTMNADNSITDITAITLANIADKFQEVFYVEDSATFTQTSVKDTSKHFIDQVLEFKVDVISPKLFNELQNGRYIALVQFPDENWYLVGTHKLGLSSKGDNTYNAAADDSTPKLSLKGICLGVAPNITMTEDAVEALINAATV